MISNQQFATLEERISVKNCSIDPKKTLIPTLFSEWKMPPVGWTWDSETEGVRWGAQPRVKGVERETETEEEGDLKAVLQRCVWFTHSLPTGSVLSLYQVQWHDGCRDEKTISLVPESRICEKWLQVGGTLARDRLERDAGSRVREHRRRRAEISVRRLKRWKLGGLWTINNNLQTGG